MSEYNDNNSNEGITGERKVPGLRLRMAREASGLSQKEAASYLKLSVEKIKSLEQGAVANLAAPVFVTGYFQYKGTHIKSQ